MRAALRRELLVIVASPGVWIASVLQLLVLGAFVLVWGDGLPIHDGPSLPEQFGLIQTTLACVLLPWAALRCAAPRGACGITRLALATAIAPRRLLLARTAATAAALVLVVSTALPLMVVIQQASAGTVAETAAALIPPMALTVVAAVMACLASVLLRGDVPAWAAASIATGAVAFPPGHSTALSVGLAVAAIGLLIYWAGHRLDYLQVGPLDAGYSRSGRALERTSA